MRTKAAMGPLLYEREVGNFAFFQGLENSHEKEWRKMAFGQIMTKTSDVFWKKVNKNNHESKVFLKRKSTNFRCAHYFAKKVTRVAWQFWFFFEKMKTIGMRAVCFPKKWRKNYSRSYRLRFTQKNRQNYTYFLGRGHNFKSFHEYYVLLKKHFHISTHYLSWYIV